MSDPPPQCKCIADCNALHEIATTTSDNLKALFLDQLKSGVIGVPACVWAEFKDLYEEEAEALEEHVLVKITLTVKYRMGAARKAEKLNSGFSRGPYDNGNDFYTGAIASQHKCRVLTSSAQQVRYKTMGCKVSDLATWAKEQ
jgi:hypothetical protein